MKKLFLVAVVAMLASVGVKAQSVNGKGNNLQCTYLCERNEVGEVVKLVEYMRTPNGKMVARPIIVKGGGPILEKPNAGLSVNCKYNSDDHACYGPNNIDCTCIGTIPSGPEDL